MDTSRRKFIVGLGTIIAAPAIVRASSLMKVKPLKPTFTVYGFDAFGKEVHEIIGGPMQVRRLGLAQLKHEGMPTSFDPDYTSSQWWHVTYEDGKWTPRPLSEAEYIAMPYERFAKANRGRRL